jgi:hypothetical protein
MNIHVQENFPDGKALAQTLHDSGFKGVWMLDPGIKYEEKEGYEAYDTGCEKDVWVQTADGKPYVGMVSHTTLEFFCIVLKISLMGIIMLAASSSNIQIYTKCNESLSFSVCSSLCALTSCGQSLSRLFFLSAGECWPGPVVFPDFTQSKVRTWWAELVKEFVGNDIDGIWNDMNEPAVFKVTQTLIPLPTSTSLLIVSISRNMAYQHKITYFLSLYGCRLSGFAACGLCQCCDRKEGCCMWVMNRQYQRQCQSRIYTKETKTWVALNRTLTTTMCTLQSFLSFFFRVF